MKKKCEKCQHLFSTRAGNYDRHSKSCTGNYVKFEKAKCCKYCNMLFGEEMPTAARANHSRWCDKNPKKTEYIVNTEVMRTGITDESREKMKIGIKLAWARGAYVDLSHKIYNTKIKNNTLRHSEKSKRLMSEKRKEYLLNNPDKHPWKKNKFKSIPCENIKNFLKEKNFKFEEEFQPLCDRFFSIDIAFTDIKLGIEINGNQHYSEVSTNTLTEYYQKRHDLIEKSGWKSLEVNYAYGFKIDDFCNILKNENYEYFCSLFE